MAIRNILPTNLAPPSSPSSSLPLPTSSAKAKAKHQRRSISSRVTTRGASNRTGLFTLTAFVSVTILLFINFQRSAHLVSVTTTTSTSSSVLFGENVATTTTVLTLTSSTTATQSSTAKSSLSSSTTSIRISTPQIDDETNESRIFVHNASVHDDKDGNTNMSKNSDAIDSKDKVNNNDDVVKVQYSVNGSIHVRHDGNSSPATTSRNMNPQPSHTATATGAGTRTKHLETSHTTNIQDTSTSRATTNAFTTTTVYTAAAANKIGTTVIDNNSHDRNDVTLTDTSHTLKTFVPGILPITVDLWKRNVSLPWSSATIDSTTTTQTVPSSLLNAAALRGTYVNATASTTATTTTITTTLSAARRTLSASMIDSTFEQLSDWRKADLVKFFDHMQLLQQHEHNTASTSPNDQNGPDTVLCTCIDPANATRDENPCCLRLIIRAHKMGYTMNVVLLEQYKQLYAAPRTFDYDYLEKLSHYNDFRISIVFRDLYESFVSGYLYHVKGHERYIDEWGNEINGSFTGRAAMSRFWWKTGGRRIGGKRYMTYTLDPDNNRRRICEYMRDEGEYKGMRAYIEWCMYGFYKSMFEVLALAKQNKYVGDRTHIACYEELGNKKSGKRNVDLQASNRMLDFLYDGHQNHKVWWGESRLSLSQQTAGAKAMLSNKASAHATSHDPAVRGNLIQLIQQIDREHYNGDIAWLNSVIPCHHGV